MPRGCAIALLIATSIFGALLTLVALSFVVFNERQSDLASLVRASRVVRPDDPGAADGALVSLTGVVELEGAGLGDEQFLAPGNYLKLERTVEMYAWEEYKSHEDSQGRPVYRRRKIWTRTTAGLGHVSNPAMPLKGATMTAAAARIGEVRIDPGAADLPLPDGLPLTRDLLLPGVQGTIQDGVLYVGAASPSRPDIGDLRVSYRAVPAGRLVTVFAALAGDRMVAYQAADGQAVYDMLAGDRETALRDFGAVQVIANWMVRLLAAAAIWFGLLLLFYASRRLVAWPRALGITAGSVRLASAAGLALVGLALGSLWLSGGSMLAFGAALGVAAGAAAAAAFVRRARTA